MSSCICIDAGRAVPKSVLSLVLFFSAALLLCTFTAMRAGAFEYLEIPEKCQVIDALNPFPDISDWNLVEEQDMAVMEDNSIRMCRRKTFIHEDSNRRLFVVYFKGKPELYWYSAPTGGEKKKELSEMFPGDESEDPHKASDYMEQSKKNIDMDFGLLRF
ncbi:hypothetical protein DPQ33_01765 [Oceanidesulfovibrio indonesiensis]|uniref:Uncharacterized protein n=1 Tax=Oceanidesulfovibrio indonesiensis TaxID=54767 RepID=A0A7M3MK86_9BACT|nr:hypothetical protein [Oceanidesulfovibrio indonesiensis]TVM19978.1 hypothetical protein DPQ33_01765 [Oceanidesulfovibrio indonesiensis]